MRSRKKVEACKNGGKRADKKGVEIYMHKATRGKKLDSGRAGTCKKPVNRWDALAWKGSSRVQPPSPRLITL